MKRILIILLLAVAAFPAFAQMGTPIIIPTLMLIDKCFQAFDDELVGTKIQFSSHADDLYE